ncbi:hypothetical protein ABZ865_30450 [Streptomyces sp. NPDC047085]|uniref:hypothetical protein n=1 Tax=Streptomyces sp. NPDC047085 TaxID=3155140 RepID=UPI0033F8A161
MLGLQTGCCPEVASGRHLIYGREFKNAFDEDGNHHSAGRLREVPWVAIPPVARAIRVLEKIAPAEGLVFDASTHTFVNTPTPSTTSLRYSGLRTRIEAFVAWASRWPCAWDGKARSFPTIRTARSVWPGFAAPWPGTSHAVRAAWWRWPSSTGTCAPRSAAGTPPAAATGSTSCWDIETARAAADTLTTIHDDLARRVGISGPAARRAIHAAA